MFVIVPLNVYSCPSSIDLPSRVNWIRIPVVGANHVWPPMISLKKRRLSSEIQLSARFSFACIICCGSCYLCHHARAHLFISIRDWLISTLILDTLKPRCQPIDSHDKLERIPHPLTPVVSASALSFHCRTAWTQRRRNWNWSLISNWIWKMLSNLKCFCPVTSATVSTWPLLASVSGLNWQWNECHFVQI